jgi:dimethylamine/trimethylamine dehydrogenase
VLVYDDDHYYMGSVLAELLALQGSQVTLATPAPSIAEWAQYTLEQPHTLRRLLSLGVGLHTHTRLAAIEPGRAQVRSAVRQSAEWVECDGVVLVSNRRANDGLYYDLKPALAGGRLDSLRVIGDAEAPNIIAGAVFSGHLAAQEFDEVVDLDVPNFNRERLGV